MTPNHEWSGISMIALNESTSALPLLDALSTNEFLIVVGKRIRRQRAEKSMSRKKLAEVSGVSERYLAQLESGQGNMSIALLRKVTGAIDMSLGALMSEQVTETCLEVNQLNRKESVVIVESTEKQPSRVISYGERNELVADI